MTTPTRVTNEELRKLASATPEPLIVVRSEARKRDGTICGQTEVKYFITTEALRRENDWIIDTHDEAIATLIIAAVNSLPSLLDENAVLAERCKRLEGYLEHTADGKLVVECESLYCPKCSQEVRVVCGLAYCDLCVNPDGGAWPLEPPLPLSFESCLAQALTQKETPV